jgi:hypothetical protein
MEGNVTNFSGKLPSIFSTELIHAKLAQLHLFGLAHAVKKSQVIQ